MPIVQILRCYFMGYDFNAIARDDLLGFLNSRPEVRNWYTILPGQILIVSLGPAAALSQLISTQFPGQIFMVAEIQGVATSGLMPKDVWEFINNPKSSGHWEAATNPMLLKGLGKPPGN